MLRSIGRLFSRHPAEQGESYVRHMGVAASIGGSMILAGFACLVHAVLPFWFKTTASRTLEALVARIARRGGSDGVVADRGE